LFDMLDFLLESVRYFFYNFFYGDHFRMIVVISTKISFVTSIPVSPPSASKSFYTIRLTGMYLHYCIYEF
jgi:hypothetical protein